MCESSTSSQKQGLGQRPRSVGIPPHEWESLLVATLGRDDHYTQLTSLVISNTDDDFFGVDEYSKLFSSIEIISVELFDHREIYFEWHLPEFPGLQIEIHL